MLILKKKLLIYINLIKCYNLSIDGKEKCNKKSNYKTHNVVNK